MDRITVLQTQADAPAGHLDAWARERGARLEVVDVALADELPPPGDADAVVALGSDASWAASDRPAWMDRELEWLAAAEAAEVAVLGICFGAQALALVHGGAVVRMPRPEIGWLELELEPGADVPAGPWLAWHEDRVEVPPDARVLARTPPAVHAFEVGRDLAVQFHPEVDAAIVRGWVDAYGGRDLGDEVGSPEALVARSAQEDEGARARAFALFDAFAARAAG
jgi:GMP synthase-like glutamine amidotransferase